MMTTRKKAVVSIAPPEKVEFKDHDDDKKGTRRNAVTVKAAKRKSIGIAADDSLLAPKNIRSEEENAKAQLPSVKITLTKSGGRSKAMQQIKAESVKVKQFDEGEHYRAGVMITTMESDKLRKTIHQSIHDDFSQHAALTVPMSVDDESFVKESKTDKDFLHHADDLVHMVLELPHGFHPKPTEPDTSNPETALQSILLGLPGGLSLSPAITNKYFGENSRAAFFDRFHQISNQSLLYQEGSRLNLSICEDDISDLGDFDDDFSSSHQRVQSSSSHQRMAPFSPAEVLVSDHFENLEEYIPFAPRRPCDEVDDTLADPPDSDLSLSKARSTARITLLSTTPVRIPTIEEILGAESVVVEKIAAQRKAEADRIAAAAEEAEMKARKAQRLSATARQDAAKLRSKSGKVLIPPLHDSRTSVLASSTVNNPISQPRYTLLQRPLSPKTVDVIAAFQDEKNIAEMNNAASTRLRVMHSDENITEDPEKFEKMSEEQQRREKEEKDRKRLDAMKARLRETVETWKLKSVKEDASLPDFKKFSMLSDNERAAMVSLRSQPVDVKPVKYVSGTKGKLLSMSKSGAIDENDAKGTTGENLVVAEKKKDSEESRQRDKQLRNGDSPASTAQKLRVQFSAALNSSKPKSPKFGFTKDFETSMKLIVPGGSGKSNADIQSDNELDSDCVESIAAYSLNGLLVGPGGFLDDSIYDDEKLVSNPGDACIPRQVRRARGGLMTSTEGEDISIGNASSGYDTVTLVAKVASMAIADESVDISPEPPSPRTVYLGGCLRENLNPRPSLVIRRNLTKKLELQHQGMGDEMAQVLAESFGKLPYVQSINLTDNRLTDVGLGPLLEAALVIPGLVELNLSQNEIGPIAAKRLFDFLCSADCPLQKLVLANADVDDSEAADFIQAVKANRSLTELILSNNKIGEAENYNTVFPDYQTGGEAIADLLCDPGCKITYLRLDWNKIRLDSGIQIAESLAKNNVLTYLDLSYNTLGPNGGVILGKSLEINKTLKTLLVANNGLNAAACITICAGVIENKAIKNVYMDGNPIGSQGSKILMMVPLIVGSRVKVSGKRCNVAIKDPDCPYDFVNILSSYDLDMENPFERAVFMMLIHITSTHHTYNFANVEHTVPFRSKSAGAVKGKGGKGGGAGRNKTVELIQSFNEERVPYFDESQRRVLENLNRVQKASGDIESAIALFQEIDRDGSGALDRYELEGLLTSLGVETNEMRIAEVMYTYDVDGGGNIEIPEFLSFLRSQNYEAACRIKDLTQIPIIAVKSSPSVRFVPPAIGRFRFKITDGFTRKKNIRVMSACDKDYITEVSAGAGADSIQMIFSGVKNSMMRLNEGLSMFSAMMQETRHKIQVLANLLPQMADNIDAKQLIVSALNYNRSDILLLKRKMKYALKPILGEPNGYYMLDLTDEMDRLCITRLLEISRTTARNKMEKSKLGYGLVGDLSQHGNWSCFRNEMFNGEHFIVTLGFANPLPRSGKLEFDFSVGSRPPLDCMSLNDHRCVQVLINNFLLLPEYKEAAIRRLALHKKMGEVCLDCDGRTLHAASVDRAVQIAYHQDRFLEHLKERQEMVIAQSEFEKSGKSSGGMDASEEKREHLYNHFKIIGFDDSILNEDELADVTLSGANFNNLKTFEGSSACFAERLQRNVVSEPSRSRGTKLIVPDIKSPNPSTASTPKSLFAGSSKMSFPTSPAPTHKDNDGADDEELEEDEKEGGESDQEFMANYKRLLDSKKTSVAMKARRIIELLLDVLSRTFISSRQLTLILDCFYPVGCHKSTRYFGTYNVELIIAFFNKITDMHNFELVLTRLTAFEAGCLYCRLGILSIYNPCKPEGAIEVTLSRWEERLVAKILCFLATIEPGENWIGETFRHFRQADLVPGWELTQSWLTDDGMPRKGVLTLEYYSGECQFKCGCQPNIPARKSLLNLVLIEEFELVEDGFRGRDGVQLVGDKAIKAELPRWSTFLAPPKESDERIASDFQKLLKFDAFAAEQEGKKQGKGGATAPAKKK